MHLHEYQAKFLLYKNGMSIPKGIVCKDPSCIQKHALKISSLGPWVLKCQVHTGSRAKSGAIKIVKKKCNLQKYAMQLFKKKIDTYQSNRFRYIVDKILVEEYINSKHEIYLSIIVDRKLQKLMFLASSHGGIDIEKNKQHIYSIVIDITIGAQLWQGRSLALKLKLPTQYIDAFSEIFVKLTDIFLKYDLSLIEINPLAINSNNNFICIDSKISVDDNALFRQKKLKKMYDHKQEHHSETLAKKFNLNYVIMDGNIGCMVNGAGLALSTIDIIKFRGGNVANFLDIGGDVTKNAIIEGLKIIISDNVKVILVNIFGGIVKCDLVSKGILDTLTVIKSTIPIVVRLEGNSAAAGIELLKKSKLNIFATRSFSDALKKLFLLLR